MQFIARHKGKIALALLLGLIVAAHVGLWLSDRMPVELKWRLTMINVLGWTVVLGPIWFVNRWLKAHTDRNAE